MYNPSKLKIFLYSFVIFLVFIVALEVGCRIAISFYLNSWTPMRLGFETISTKVNLQRPVQGSSVIETQDGAFGAEGEIWAFGGSTTYGHNCAQASSWPEILDALRDDYLVRNFGANGQNSDYALEKLESLLKRASIDDQITIPKIVLWANRTNETDVLSFGLGRNIHHISGADKSSFQNFINRALYLNAAAMLSMQQYSAAFIVFDRFLSLISPSSKGADHIIDRGILELSADNLSIAAANYRLNTEMVLKFSEIYNFKVAIVRLVNLADLEKREYKKTGWNEVFFRNQDVLSNHKNATLVDTRPSVTDLFEGNTWFCDEVHQTIDGNRWTAIKIQTELNSKEWLVE